MNQFIPIHDSTADRTQSKVHPGGHAISPHVIGLITRVSSGTEAKNAKSLLGKENFYTLPNDIRIDWFLQEVRSRLARDADLRCDFGDWTTNGDPRLYEHSAIKRNTSSSAARLHLLGQDPQVLREFTESGLGRAAISSFFRRETFWDDLKLNAFGKALSCRKFCR